MANDDQILKKQVFLKNKKWNIQIATSTAMNSESTLHCGHLLNFFGPPHNVDWLGHVTVMVDEKIEALTAKVNVLAESMVALATTVHSLQRSLPQAPPPPPLTRWMKKAAQKETYPIKDNQIEMVVDDVQQQHEKQLFLDIVDLNQESPKEKDNCKMNISNSNDKPVGSHLDLRQKRNFVPLGVNLGKVFCILEAKGVLKPLQLKFPNSIQKGGGYSGLSRMQSKTSSIKRRLIQLSLITGQQ
ncbi:hypothetical protein RHMOL_Rhmol01G0235300 [Rhododendron molle]|uniref:Uncharacterized protein n=1 Tax=Rhododendron molle TaxID=49168 RepID=A0ACC0Q5Z3_RHOML|nr:hypothetical protein RHMOL_Rhmol01G0235300 [Rhododendron molle]